MGTFKEKKNKNAAAKGFGLFAVVLCFTFVLSLFLATGSVAFAEDDDLWARHEQAYYNEDESQDNETMGKAEEAINTITERYADDEEASATLTAADFEFFGTVDGKKTWTVEEKFKKGMASATNHETYTAMAKKGADTVEDTDNNKLVTYYECSDYVFKTGTYCNGWGVTGSGDSERNWYMMSANYEIGDFLKALVKDEKYTVTFELYMKSTGLNLDTTFVGAWLTDNAKTGEENYGMVYTGNHDGKENQYPDTVFWHKGSGNGTDVTDRESWSRNNTDSVSITLTEDMDYVSVFAGAWYKCKYNWLTPVVEDKLTTIDEMSFYFTVTYDGDEDIATQAPTLSDDNGYAVQNDDYTIPTRNWLNSYTYCPTVTFENEVFATFNQGFNLYVAVKYFNSATAFETYEEDAHNIGNDDGYKGITDDNLEYFGIDALFNASFGDTSIDLLSSKGAGLRLVYVWVVDPDGEFSGINSYYVLVDTKEYNASASIGDSAGSVSISDATVNRGQTVTVTVKLNGGYVPYRFNNGNVNLLFNDTEEDNFDKAGSDFDSFVSVEHEIYSDEYTIRYTVDDDSLKTLEYSFDFTVSARKVVTPTYTAAVYRHIYSGSAPDTSNYISLRDADANQYLTFAYFDKSGNALDSAPVNAGSYSVEVFAFGNNENYVLPSNYLTASPLQSVALTIAAKPVTVTPVASESEYGEPINLTFNHDFVVVNGERLVGSIKLDTTSSNPLSVRKYAITEDTQFAVLTSDGQASGNYTVTFTAGVEHTVYAKSVTITPNAFTSVYGEPINLTYTHDFAAVDGETLDVALKLDTASWGGVVGADTYDIVFDKGSVKKDGQESGNYTVSLSSAGYTVTKKAVTVTPTATQSEYGETINLTYTHDFAAVDGEVLDVTLKLDTASWGGIVGADTYDIVFDKAAVKKNATVSGNYTVVLTPTRYTVNAQSVTITPVSTNSKYGETVNLTYNHDFVAVDGETLDVTLKLKDVNLSNTLAVGKYDIVLDEAAVKKNGTVSNNYTVALSETLVQHTVNAKTVTVTPVASESEYGAQKNLTYTHDFEAEDGEILDVTLKLKDVNLSNTLAVGKYDIVLDEAAVKKNGTVSNNYTVVLNTPTVQHTVNAKTVTITPIASESEYGAPINLTFIHDFVAVDGEVLDVTLKLDTANWGGIVGADTYDIVFDKSAVKKNGANSKNYNVILSETLVQHTVNEKTVTVTPIASESEYGETVNLTYTHDFVAVDGETLSVSLKLKDVNLSNALAVGTYDIVLDEAAVKKNGANSNDYNVVLSETRVEHTVNAKTVTITPVASESEYGETINLTYTHDFAAVDGETLDVTLKLDTASWGGVVGADTYDIVLDKGYVKKGGQESGNYTVALSGTIERHTVNAKTVTVTPVATQSEYGETINLTYTHDFVAINGETLSVTLKLKDVDLSNTLAVGTYDIVLDEAAVKKNGTVSNNYDVVLSETLVQHTVNAKTVTVTPTATQSKYGEQINLTYTHDFAAEDGELLDVTLKLKDVNLSNALAVGKYDIVLDKAAVKKNGTVSNNYTVVLSTPTVQHTVNAKPVTVTPVASESEYGEPINLTFNHDFVVVNGERLVGSIKLDTTSSNPLSVRKYAITEDTQFAVLTSDGQASGNYTVTFTAGVEHTVYAKSVTITPNAFTSVYGEPINLTYTHDFIAVDGETLDVTLKLDTASRGSVVGADTYDIVFDKASVKKDGQESGNYTVSLSSARYTVSPKTVTITPNVFTSVYGEPINLTYTHDFAAVDGETLDVSLKLDTASWGGVVGADTYDIAFEKAAVKKNDTDSNDYTVVLTPARYTVTKKAVTVTPNATYSVYGEQINLTYTHDFVAVNGEKLVGSLKLETTNSNPLNVSKYAIIEDTRFAVLTSDGQTDGNYTVTFTEGVEHTVNKRPIQITVSGKTAIKDGSAPNGVVPKYTLADGDAAYASLVATEVSGKFILTESESGTEGIPEIYSKYYVYTVTLGNIDSQNLTITLAPNAKYTVYILVPGLLHEVETENGDASVNIENGTTANKLVVEEIDEDNNTDDELWDTVSAGVSDINDKAELISIVKLELYNNDTPVDCEGTVTVSVAIPDAVSDLGNVQIYLLNPEGGLQLLENYTFDNGKLAYTADNLGAIVFLNINNEVPVDPVDPNPVDPNPLDPNPDDSNFADPDPAGPSDFGDGSEDKGQSTAKGMSARQIILIVVIVAAVVAVGAIIAVIFVRKSKQKK